MCMFDKFHLTFNFKSKVSYDVLKTMNANWHIHFILKCHLNFGLQFFFEINILNNQIQSWFVKILKINLAQVSFGLACFSKDGCPIHCIQFKPTKRNPHKSIKGLEVQLIAQVAFDCIFFGKSSLTNSYIWWNEYNLLPKLHKFRPIFMPFQIATTYAPNLKYWFDLTLMLECFRKFQEFSLTHVAFFFSVLKL